MPTTGGEDFAASANSSSRRPLRLLHTSDCHLGGDEGGELEAFDAAIEAARLLAVDVVLIAGDLFDHDRIDDSILDHAANRLGDLPCPTVLIAGNHDAHHRHSIYGRFDAGVRGASVHFLDNPYGAVLPLPGLDVEVWGRAMTAHVPGFFPLAGAPARPGLGWGVLMAHGLVVDDGPTMRASPIRAVDLARPGWDYIALGHVHRHQVVSTEPTVACYSGATASADRGRPAVVLVDLIDGASPMVQLAPLDTTR